METVKLNYFQVKTKEDGKAILDGVAIVKDALKNSMWGNGEIDEKQIELLVQLYLVHPDPKSRGLFVAMDGPLYVGLLAAVIGGNALVKQANELMWNVLPMYREQGVGNELIKMYEAWAKGEGVSKVTMSHYDDDIGDSLSKLYIKSGYRKTEITYVKDLD